MGPRERLGYSVTLPDPRLSRSLGLFDATMIVMGGIIGSGIFISPYVVAQRVHTAAAILSVWLAGGLLAIIGAFVWAELACTLPGEGGQYLYLREAYSPAVAFLYGWVLLLVIQTGGMAAVAVTFARYCKELTGWTVPDSLLASAALLGLTAVNCLGARAGSNVQSVFMILKCAAIAALIIAAFTVQSAARPIPPGHFQTGWLHSWGAALIPVAFAYGGWQTASFVAGEMRDPRRDLSRGLVLGVLGVVVLYIGVNAACIRALGPQGLAATSTPASAVMRAAWGAAGARWLALGIAVSTIGFLSQGMLTAPRVYYAMAADGLFFRAVARVSGGTGVPVTAIVLQGLLASAISFFGRYEQILNYVVSIDFIFFGLTAASVFVLRSRVRQAVAYRVPGHPVTTGIFVLGCAAIVFSTVAAYPRNSMFGLLLLVAGVPVYAVWNRRRLRASIPI